MRIGGCSGVSRGGRSSGGATVRSCRRNTSQTTTASSASPMSATGASAAENCRNVRPDTDPISMFCGLPVTVAALPMLDAVASARRYGSGRCRRASATSMTTGVNTRQIVSWRKSADSPPVTKTSASSTITGCVVRPLTRRTSAARPPASLRCATRTIMPKRSTSVRKLIAPTAASKPIAPVTSISTAPMIAAPVRSTRRPGARPMATTAYVARKIRKVVTRPSGRALRFADARQPDLLRLQPRHGAAQLDQLEELHARAPLIAERAEHRAGDGERILLFDAAHRHAEVRRFHDDGDAERIDRVADRVRDLIREALLHLQASREDVDEPRDF